MISILLSARPSYAKLHPLINALLVQGADLEVVACGAALLHRYGRVVDQLRTDFPEVPVTTIYSTYEGATLETSVKETAALLSSLGEHYARTYPDLVVVTADRHETAAGSLAAAYLNISVVHLQGGERSGNIDHRVRQVNTALATYHFPCTESAKYRLLGLTGGAEHRIWNYGCPSIDVARAAQSDPPVESTDELGGIGPMVWLEGPFLLLLLHPETEHPELAATHMETAVAACNQVPLPRVVVWPGQDAGSEESAKVLRETMGHQCTWHAVRTIPPRRFLRLLGQAAVLVGNSSAGIREASYLGTPVVNIGDRQRGRERARNVVDVPFDRAAITDAIQRRGFARLPSTLYGNGTAAPRIAAQLVQIVGGP